MLRSLSVLFLAETMEMNLVANSRFTVRSRRRLLHGLRPLRRSLRARPFRLASQTELARAKNEPSRAHFFAR